MFQQKSQGPQREPWRKGKESGLSPPSDFIIPVLTGLWERLSCKIWNE